MNQLNHSNNLHLNLHMKIKDNDYYKKLYIRLLNAYDLKRNNTQVAMYNRYSKINHHYKNHDYKNLIYECFNRNFKNIFTVCNY